jgi:hypothetical protein
VVEDLENGLVSPEQARLVYAFDGA